MAAIFDFAFRDIPPNTQLSNVLICYSRVSMKLGTKT